MLPRASLCRKKLYAEKTKQTPGPYALAVSGPQPVRCHPVCAGPLCGDGAPQRDRHDGATLCGPCQLYGGTGQRCVPTGGGTYGAVYRSMRSAAAGAQSGTGFGATGERLKKYLLGRGLPHDLFAAHGFAGGKPCTALESIVCPKRPCERNFWHPL